MNKNRDDESRVTDELPVICFSLIKRTGDSLYRPSEVPVTLGIRDATVLGLTAPRVMPENYHICYKGWKIF